MEWHDEGIVLGSRPCQEHGRIIVIFTQDHGLYKGYWHRSRKTAPYSIGDRVAVRWRARLAEQLGFWTLESLYSPLGFLMALPHRIGLIQIIASLLAQNMPQAHPYPALYNVVHDLTLSWTSAMTLEELLISYLRFEHTFLHHTGYGLGPWSDLEPTSTQWRHRYHQTTARLCQHVWHDHHATPQDLRHTILDPLIQRLWGSYT